jgi:DNA-binding transcriptional regulator YhcF (GntR family)
MAAFPLIKWYALQLVIIDPNVTTSGKVVFARLMNHHNTKTGRCFPSEATLAHALGCTERSIRTALKSLEKHKYIRVHRGKGRNGTNQYDLYMPSGKNEYFQAEKTRLSDRKKSSAKPMKEPLKEQERNIARAKFMSEKRQRDSFDEKSDAKKQGQLSGKFVEYIGNDEKGWDLLLRINEQTMLEIENRFLKGDLSLNAAVELLFKASQCVE